MSKAGFWDVVKALIEKKKDDGNDSKGGVVITVNGGNVASSGGSIATGNTPQRQNGDIPNRKKHLIQDNPRNRVKSGYKQEPRQSKSKVYKNTTKNGAVTFEAIQLYSTGAGGKVYTTTFYKSLNHNFGVEVTIRNSTNRSQSVHVGLCVYDDRDNAIQNFKGSSEFTVKANYTAVQPIFADAKAFSRMKPGRYKYQIWINNRAVLKDYFIIM